MACCRLVWGTESGAILQFGQLASGTLVVRRVRCQGEVQLGVLCSDIVYLEQTISGSPADACGHILAVRLQITQ